MKKVGAVALAHRPSILLALDKHRAAFVLKLCGQPIEFGAPGMKRCDRRRHSTRRVVRFRIVGFIESSEIVADSDRGGQPLR